jgi:DNA-binding MarR family transcriptional regulator
MTHNQQAIMIYLSERVDARSSEITRDLNISNATFFASMTDLYDDDFVRKTKAGSTHVCRYFLTQDGMSVAVKLIRYTEMEGNIVPPRSIDKMAGVYVPTECYQRNQGHKSLTSRGFQC